ncbi:hypothetical protein [Fictibacillus sp. FJAT-27399]|uniref:hypothetical protein n=1 Tax=Fictibacillus sp. FJAT-27399 TaxID=1729689 RepID=UPI0007823D15|nr:hypothetical protein [Fictibacillus sp. FJAT-27399]
MDREGTTNPGDIALKEGYRIEAAVKGFQHPISLLFTASGRLIVGEAGVATGYGRVIEVTRQGDKVMQRDLNLRLLASINMEAKSMFRIEGKLRPLR